MGLQSALVAGVLLARVYLRGDGTCWESSGHNYLMTDAIQ
jgi:hypothetical protein